MSAFPKSILQFDNLSSFLSEYYQHRKQKSARFSYEFWARSIKGINRSHLKQITNGVRSVPADRVESLIRYFKFRAEEKQHFLDLVAITGGVSHKASLQRKIRDRVRYYQDLFIVHEVEKFLEIPEIPILATLMTFKDLPSETSVIADMMGVKENTLLKWLEILENLGFVKKTGHGQWKNTKNSFRIPAQLGQESLLNYHRKSLERAIAGLKALKEERNYEASLLALTPEEYREYLAMLDEFRTEVLGRFNASILKGRHLYQINFAISPVLRDPLLGSAR